MFVNDLFKEQKEFDEKLRINPELTEYKIKARKNLELHVKLSDLANATQCFAYTEDVLPSINDTTIFSKYLDCLKQVLSIGITNHYDNLNELFAQPTEDCLSDQFLNLYIDINDLIISRSEDHFKTLFEDLLTLGSTLGFSEDKIKGGLEKTFN